MSSNPFRITSHNSPRGTLTGKYRKAWTEEALDLEDITENRWGITHTRRYLGSSISYQRLYILIGIVIFFGLIIFARVIYLQAGKGTYYQSLAEGNRIRLRSIPAERGVMYDHFEKQLVYNIPNFSLVLVPHDLPREVNERERLLDRIGEMSEKTTSSLNTLLTTYGLNSYEPIIIKENIDFQTALSLYITNANLPGVSIESGTRRWYGTTIKEGARMSLRSLAHILGYMGKLDATNFEQWRTQGYLLQDTIGKAGLEKTYETELRGKYGRKRIEVDALGKEQAVLAVEPPEPGKNLQLTIDLEAQAVLEKIITQLSEKTDHHRYAAIALDPKNGHILALVSWPTFDNNEFASGIKPAIYDQYLKNPDHPLFNRAIAGTYPSGSTIKLIVAAAALQEHIVVPTTVFNSVGGLHVGRWFFKDWKAGGHGWTNITKALAWSVNTFFYYVGGGYDAFEGLGIERLLHYMSLFNLAQKTGIDLPGENTGFLPSREWKQQTKGEPWFIGDTYNLSIGQGSLLVTPLQVAVWTAAIANGGIVLQTHLVEKIIDPITKQITVIPDTILHQNFIAPHNISVVQQGMRECVRAGSCKLLGTLPFTTAGKTGTAQWSHNQPTHAWFTSFAPVSNPQIVVTVLAEEGGEGATAAMPIARNFLEWWGKKYLNQFDNK